jgi:hypothetical protein
MHEAYDRKSRKSIAGIITITIATTVNIMTGEWESK